MPDGSLQFLAYGLDRLMYHTIRLADGTWQGWRRVNSDSVDKGFNGGPLAITSTPDGTMHAVAVDSSGNLVHTLRRPDGTWQPQGWTGVAGNDQRVFKARDVAVVGLPDSSIKVLASDQNGPMQLTGRRADGLWDGRGWTTVPGVGGWPTFAGFDLALSAAADHAVQIAAIGLDNKVWLMTQTRGGINSAWTNPQWRPNDPMRGWAVSITTLPDGSAQIAAVGMDGNAWHSVRPAGRDWAPFEPLERAWGRPLAASGVGITALPGGRTYILAHGR
jgi:hypothetical protein